MDFIERLSGIAPDGGSGELELMLLAVAVLIVGSLASSVVATRSRPL
jgi:hypothetical protein